MGRVNLLTGLLDTAMLLEALSPAYTYSWGFKSQPHYQDGLKFYSIFFLLFFLSIQWTKEWKRRSKWLKWGQGIIYNSFSERVRSSDLQGEFRVELLSLPIKSSNGPGIWPGWEETQERSQNWLEGNISHLHPRKPQHDSMGASCRWWGDDSLRFYYWNRRPFDPNPGLNIKYSWTGNKFVFVQFKTQVFQAWNCCAWSLYQRLKLWCMTAACPPLWAADLNTTFDPDTPTRQEGWDHQIEWVSDTSLKT